MSNEIAEMRIRLEVAKDKKFKRKKEFENLVDSIRRQLNYELTPIENIPMDDLRIIYDRIEEAWAEILALISDIDRLERKLG